MSHHQLSHTLVITSEKTPRRGREGQKKTPIEYIENYVKSFKNILINMDFPLNSNFLTNSASVYTLKLGAELASKFDRFGVKDFEKLSEYNQYIQLVELEIEIRETKEHLRDQLAEKHTHFTKLIECEDNKLDLTEVKSGLNMLKLVDC